MKMYNATLVTVSILNGKMKACRQDSYPDSTIDTNFDPPRLPIDNTFKFILPIVMSEGQIYLDDRVR
jgi:hypothetical protein